MHRTACAVFERVAGYWHMLPQAAQARKAIWDAVNPHTGRKRIDEAFPLPLRRATRGQEMQIEFINGSTWQVVGSDNFNSLVGSTPAGVVYSEWALAKPAARAYLRPIFAENNGWQMFITTPRGKNHAYRTFEAAKRDPHAFAQRLSVRDTGVLSDERLETELQAYVKEFGEDQGRAMFEQEYECSFDAALLGAYYGAEFRNIEELGRICEVEYQPGHPVFTAWDIGYNDDTSIWFYQVIKGEIHVIDFHTSNAHDIDWYCDLLEKRGYDYAKLGSMPFLWLPHDARAKTFASGGKSVQEQFEARGYKSLIVPELSLQDGIQASRQALKRCYFDATKCEDGIEALRMYQREWDDDNKMFKDRPLHNWASHPADAFRYLAIAWRELAPKTEEKAPKFPIGVQNGRIVTEPLETLWAQTPKRKNERI